MPKKKNEFTRQEKDEIIARHKYLVDTINNLLPDEMKLNYDETLEQRLSDPKEVEFYNVCQDIKANVEKQDAILASYKERYGDFGDHPFGRSIQYGFKLDDSPELNNITIKCIKIS